MLGLTSSIEEQAHAYGKLNPRAHGGIADRVTNHVSAGKYHCERSASSPRPGSQTDLAAPSRSSTSTPAVSRPPSRSVKMKKLWTSRASRISVPQADALR